MVGLTVAFLLAATVVAGCGARELPAVDELVWVVEAEGTREIAVSGLLD